MRLVLMLGLAALLLCGCTPSGSGVAAPPAEGMASRPAVSAPEGRPVRMALVLPEGGHTYVTQALAHAQAQLAEMAAADGLEYELETAADTAAMAAALEGVMAFAPDVVLLWPWGRSAALAPAARGVLDAGVKLVLFGGQVAGVEPTAAIVGDDLSVGRWTGQYLLKTFAQEMEAGTPIGYLRFCGDGSEAARLRSAGMDETLASMGFAGVFEALAPDVATDWAADTAKAEMAEWLRNATDAEREWLKFVVTQEDQLAEAVLEAVAEWRAENGGPLGLRLVTGVGGGHRMLDYFDAVPAGADGQAGPQPVGLVTYYYSPSFVRQAILLADAAARGAQYEGQDVTGKTFTIPTIEIDGATVAAFRAGREYVADLPA